MTNKPIFSNTNKELKSIAEIREEAYQQGRADAIEEFLKYAMVCIRDDTCGCAYDAKKILQDIAEQIKEQKNDE